MRIFCWMTLLALGAATPAPGQLQPLTPAAQVAVTDSLALLVRRIYPAPDTGAMIATRLKERASSGAYREAEGWEEFARLLTEDLRAVNEDRHLYVRIDPDAATPRREPQPEDAEASRDAVRRLNHGFQSVRVLNGNIGYLELRGLYGGAEAIARLDAAMQLLAGTDAVVLDLRESGGGSAAMANELVSYFLPGDSVLTLVARTPSEDSTEYLYSTERAGSRRRPAVPLYILTSGGSGSADEHVVFVLKNFGRALTVGARTAGAGNMNREYPLAPGVIGSVSTSIVVEPETQRGWERVGIEPDIDVPPAQALDAAHLAALERLIPGAANPRVRREIEWNRDFLRGQMQPVPVDARMLETFTGTYEGERVVTLRDGQLYYRRGTAQQPRPLGALTPTRFALTPEWQIEFLPAGADVQVQVEHVSGQVWTFPKQR